MRNKGDRVVRNFQTASPDRYAILKELACKNRNNQTEAEIFLWRQLKGGVLGVKFKRQHVIFDYIVDFVCLEKQLVIEVDGAYHNMEEQLEWDAYRTNDLEKGGFRVIRFNNELIINEINSVLETIKQNIG